MVHATDTQQRDAMPQRMSALYQYHNAPEVAPAHGLEYDDTIYPSSDKYPVVREHRAYGVLGGSAFPGNDRAPRIIFGMKVKTFLLVALIMILIAVGAAVGGAIGGRNLKDENAGQYSNGSSPTSSTKATATASATSTFAAATPTYTPLVDCPASNNTAYTSTYDSETDEHEGAGLQFAKHCGFSSPISDSNRIGEAFVYSFSDCIEVCASYNYWSNTANCTIAVYLPDAKRPSNCETGRVASVQIGSLNPTTGSDVAILQE